MAGEVVGPSGPLELLRVGSGLPVTVFAPGLASSIEQTRPFGSGVTGTRVFFNFRGHGSSSAPAPAVSPWTYAALAGELSAVADQVGASRALGVSLGAHALMALVAGAPARFDRLVFVLPAAIDTPSPSAGGPKLADLVERGEVEELARGLVAWQPPAVRALPAVRIWARRHAGELSRTPVATALRELPSQVPLPLGVSALRLVAAPTLVVAQQGDPIHPVAVAERLAALIPGARLEVLAPGGVLWRDRPALRTLITGFLDEQP